MHFVFLTRGHIDYVEPFIKELSTRYFPFDYGKEKRIIKARLCPIQMWDYSFPKPQLDAVLNTCLMGGDGHAMLPSAQKYIWLLQKAMKLKKIPEYKKDIWLAMNKPEHTEVIGIGIREDEITNKGTEDEFEAI